MTGEMNDDGSMASSMSVLAPSTRAMTAFSDCPDLSNSSTSHTTSDNSSRPQNVPQHYSLNADVPRTVPQSSWPCFFSFRGCRQTLFQPDWVSHVSGHLQHNQPPYPGEVNCYCGESLTGSWGQIFLHIFVYHMFPPTDFYDPPSDNLSRYNHLLEYLWQVKYITSEEYQISTSHQRRTGEYYDNPRRTNRFATTVTAAEREQTLRGVGFRFP